MAWNPSANDSKNWDYVRGGIDALNGNNVQQMEMDANARLIAERDSIQSDIGKTVDTFETDKRIFNNAVSDFSNAEQKRLAQAADAAANSGPDLGLLAIIGVALYFFMKGKH